MAEHIPIDKHEALFDFLVSHAGRIIVFSGARPGQGGHGHIAERAEHEWREEFVKRGCRFDPRLTIQARSMCNPRNINHRQNLQVFHAPTRMSEAVDLEIRARPYLQDLLNIVLLHGGNRTGGLFYVGLEAAISGNPEHSLYWKRENLIALSKKCDNALEIGFGAGDSALLILLANASSKLTIIDPAEYENVEACIAYLQAVFPGRITFLKGWSDECLKRLPHFAFDMVHLDGGKHLTIDSDLQDLKAIVKRDHIIVIDDTQNTGIAAAVEEREKSGELDINTFASFNAKSLRSRWTHAIARFRVPYSIPLEDQVASDMRLIYANVNHASIYMHPESPARARAAYLINAVRNVEEAGLHGAFVEVGVAAGHSSVIAALSKSRFVDRDFYLYDTFKGFDFELPNEVDHLGISIQDYDLQKYEDEACSASAIRMRMNAAGIADSHLFLVEGLAEVMVDKFRPPSISILRLDADLFAPTYAALSCLYDLVEPGGYIIIDDYGHWKGCKEASDRFFKERGLQFPGEQIDYTCYGWRK